MTFARYFPDSRRGRFLWWIAKILLFGTMAGPIVLYLWISDDVSTDVAAIWFTAVGGLVLVSSWVKGIARKVDRLSDRFPDWVEISFSLLGILSFFTGIVLQFSTAGD